MQLQDLELTQAFCLAHRILRIWHKGDDMVHMPSWQEANHLIPLDYLYSIWSKQLHTNREAPEPFVANNLYRFDVL